MQKAISFTARIITLLTLIGLLYYTINDDALIKYDNRKTLNLCREEVSGGCPLLLQALEEQAVELENLKKKLSVCDHSSVQVDSGL